MAGAGFKTFNTGDVLTASDVNTYLMQQTVMVFADAAARTAAIAAPSEGMFSYLKDTNKTYRYDGSAWLDDAGTTSPLTTKGDLWTYTTTDARLASSGVNNQVLTVDTSTASGLKWATPSSGGMTSLASGTLSGASVVLSSISGSYNYLILEITNFVPATDDTKLLLRLNGDANARYAVKLGSGTGETFANTAIDTAYGNDNSVGNGTAIFQIYGYANTTSWKYVKAIGIMTNATTTTSVNFFDVNNAYNQTAAVTSITIFSSSGNLTSGNYTLWGVK